MLCDFCNESNAPFTFEARDVVISFGQVIDHHSVGAWQACAECAALIAEGDRDGLVQRAFQSLIRQHPELGDTGVLDRLRDVISAFWNARLDE